MGMGMKFLIFMAVLISYVFCPTALTYGSVSAEDSGIVVECDDSFYPYIYFDRKTGQYSGAAAEILEKTAEREGFRYTYFRKLDMGYGDKLDMLSAGKADIMVLADRLETGELIFSNPVVKDNYCVITYTENSFRAGSLADIKGKSVGVVEKSAAEGLIDGEDFPVKYFKNYNSMYTALSARTVDYIIQKQNVYYSDYFRNELFDTREEFALDNACYDFCFAFRNDSEGKRLCAAVNSTIDSFDIEKALLAYPDSSETIVERYKNQKDSRWKIAVLAAVIYSFAVGFGILYFHSRNNIGVLSAQLQMYETAFLKAQIKPHFLYNALGRIMSLCYVDGESAGVLLGNLTRYLRIIYSTETSEELITVQKELELVESYCEIERARYGEKISVKYDIGEGCNEFMIMPLIIQPLVENAIKHGLSKKLSGGSVEIVLRLENNRLIISVSDNGIGISENALKTIFESGVKNKGIGLSNIYRRLSAYGGGALVEVESVLNKGTTVRVVFPEAKKERVVTEYEYI